MFPHICVFFWHGQERETLDSHSDDASEFWKALNMCYILLELTENKNAKSCDVPSVNDFLEEVTTFMANNTFVHPLSLFLCLALSLTHLFACCSTEYKT